MRRRSNYEIGDGEGKPGITQDSGLFFFGFLTAHILGSVAGHRGASLSLYASNEKYVRIRCLTDLVGRYSVRTRPVLSSL